MTPDVSEKPLLTLGVIAYNQEEFIENAVLGAFAQTYTPVEIILSDDCSSDGTFDVLQTMVAAYTGPHRIIMNRTECNRGVGGYVNRLFQLSVVELMLHGSSE